MKKILFICLFSQILTSFAQTLTEQEALLTAQTKQLNQFIRRFNGEEDLLGKRWYKKDSSFHKETWRRKYLSILFDSDNSRLTDSVRQKFINETVNDTISSFLDFYGKFWYAEVDAECKFNGKKENLILFLKLEQAGEGWKWVISKVYFQPFQKMFSQDSTLKFLHPLSHEVDFMNLTNVLKKEKQLEKYASKKYFTDFRSLFFYELKNGNLKFLKITQTKFHFFQLKNWYFEVSYFNRNTYNSGWLISNLIFVPEKEKLNFLHQFE